MDYPITLKKSHTTSFIKTIPIGTLEIDDLLKTPKPVWKKYGYGEVELVVLQAFFHKDRLYVELKEKDNGEMIHEIPYAPGVFQRSHPESKIILCSHSNPVLADLTPTLYQIYSSIEYARDVVKKGPRIEGIQVLQVQTCDYYFEGQVFVEFVVKEIADRLYKF